MHILRVAGPVVWYQKFEYAVGHWLTKTCEHMFGTVLCCPGCFSVIRASALIDDNVLKTFTRMAGTGKHLVQFEQGEDRWLSTLLLKRGYKIDFCAASDAKTYVPDTFLDFFIQRRRWSPSTMANMIDLVKSWGEIVHNNPEINHMFMLYQAVQLVSSILAPAAVLIVIIGALSDVMYFGDSAAFFVAILPVLTFAVICLTLKQKTQLHLAAIFSTGYTFLWIMVTIGLLLQNARDSVLSPSVIFLIFVSVVFAIAALLHPNEFSCLFHGLLYYVAVPTSFIFMVVFYICNLNNVSWGTREKTATEYEADDPSILQLLVDFLRQRAPKRISPTNKGQRFNVAELTKKLSTLENFVDVDKSRQFWKHQLQDFNFYPCETNDVETQFWAELIDKHLRPLDHDTKLQDRLTTELKSLRNRCAYLFFVLNAMLIVALFQLRISTGGSNKIYISGAFELFSTIFLTLYALLLLPQFICMLLHRWRTFCQLISSTVVFEQCCSRKGQNINHTQDVAIADKELHDRSPIETHVCHFNLGYEDPDSWLDETDGVYLSKIRNKQFETSNWILAFQEKK